MTAYAEMDSFYFTLILYMLTKKRIKYVLPSVRLNGTFYNKIDILRQHLVPKIVYNLFSFVMNFQDNWMKVLLHK